MPPADAVTAAHSLPYLPTCDLHMFLKTLITEEIS